MTSYERLASQSAMRAVFSRSAQTTQGVRVSSQAGNEVHVQHASARLSQSERMEVALGTSADELVETLEELLPA